ncbi:MAG: hypothetical protein VX185_15100 [Pseudomonadota bacterium]|nr:hypothetical protein [Gammaproteobacteria bacterium]MEC8012079.1 hypothetical protein [Pseudomonadota bacterium]HBF07111.1 hypothetical protein [Gammaproteobacteria bacterium]|tara:strand:+ start:168 stop:602 length:435 start_codon:yes stop_codon:yes gene_type:complete
MVTRTQSSPLPSAQNADVSTNQTSSILSKIQPLQKAMSMITGQKSMTDTASSDELAKIAEAKAHKLAYKEYSSTFKATRSLIKTHNERFLSNMNFGHAGFAERSIPHKLGEHNSQDKLEKATAALKELQPDIEADIKSMKITKV